MAIISRELGNNGRGCQSRQGIFHLLSMHCVIVVNVTECSYAPGFHCGS